MSLAKLAAADDAELLLLIKVMVLLDEAPSNFVSQLSPYHAAITMRGVELKAHIESQRALISLHCPLPAVLQPLIGVYAQHITEEMWTEKLHVKNPRNSSGRLPWWRELRQRAAAEAREVGAGLGRSAMASSRR